MIDTIGYVRVSTEQQATEQKTSLADQRRAITELAARMGRILDPTMIFEDAGVSGATAEGRPAFMALLRYCEANPRPMNAPGLVVILNDSRLGRFTNLDEASHWRFTLDKLGWPVRFAEGDDVENPMARGVMRFIGSAQATEYRLNLKRRSLQAARSHASEGRWQQEAPFGFRRLATRADGVQRVLAVGQRKADDEVSRLTPGPDAERDAIVWMYETYATGGISLSDLARAMVKQFPWKAWSKQVCRQILHNPAYQGDIIWCRRVTDKAERKIRKVRDRSEWVVVRDAHPALVSRDVWDAVQTRMAANKRDTTATQGGYPLTGLIRCKQCGNHFAGGGGKKGPAGDVDRYRFYRDTGNTKRIPECGPPMLTLRKSWLEREVVEAIIAHSESAATRRIIDEELPKMLASAADESRGRLKVLEKEQQRLLSQRNRLVSAIAAGTLSESEASTNLVDIRARLSAIDTEVEQLRFAARTAKPINEDLIRARKLAEGYFDHLRTMTGPALRRVVAPWIARAHVDKERRVLLLDFWVMPGVDRVMQLRHSGEQG